MINYLCKNYQGQLRTNLVFIFFLLGTNSCSNKTSESKLGQLKFGELTIQEQTSIVRIRAMEYCDKNYDEVIADYFIIYNYENSFKKSSNSIYGAFQKFSLITKTLSDDKTKNISVDHVSIAETSLLLNYERYNPDKSFGTLFSTGIQFNIDSVGNILGHKGFTTFWKNNNPTTIYYTADSTMRVTNYRKK